MKGESELGFNSIDAKTCVEQLKRYSRNNRLSSNALKLAATESGLNIAGYDRPKTIKGKMYSKLIDGTSFAVKELVLIAIMLGKGSYADKARMLFEEWDEQCTGILTNTQITSLIKIYSGVAINTMVDLGFGDTDEGFATKESVVEYKTRLLTNLENGVGRLEVVLKLRS
jgi:hypothetical protein